MGRVALHEVFEMTPEVEEIIIGGPTLQKLNAEAKRQGMLSLRQDGVLNALDGWVESEVTRAILEEGRRVDGRAARLPARPGSRSSARRVSRGRPGRGRERAAWKTCSEPACLSLSPSPFPSPVDSSLPLFTPSIGPSLSPTPAQKGKLVTVDVDDTAAGMYVINVASGTKVTFTINVVNFNVLHGGLDLRSEKISTGNVLPGSSKTVEFIFDKNLIFTPFYFDTNTAAPYTIKFNLI